MLSIAFVAFAFSVWVVMVIFDSGYSLVALDGGSFNSLIQFRIFEQAQVDLLFIKISVPVPNFSWFSALGDVLTFNQGLWTGWAQFPRTIGLLSISAGLVGALVVSLFSAFLGRRGIV